jgi:hypothetical protein
MPSLQPPFDVCAHVLVRSDEFDDLRIICHFREKISLDESHVLEAAAAVIH